MGFLNNNIDLTIYAKLTPYGRQQLLKSNTSLITKFSLGDSDANYNVDSVISTGSMPTISGNLAVGNFNNNSSSSNFKIKNVIPYLTGKSFKAVELGSTEVYNERNKNGYVSLIASQVTQFFAERNVDNNYANLFKTFGLPITAADKTFFSAATYTQGGFSDTALSGLNQDKIFVIAIPNASYGEEIDGKNIEISVTTTASTYNIYGTYQNVNQLLATQDGKISEDTPTSKKFGDNITFLFSDGIKKPGNNATKSWATGFNTVKPFSLNSKNLFNIKNATNVTGDTAVGIAYLDKGFIVITDPNIVNDIDLGGSSTTSSATTVSYTHYSTEIFQSVNVFAGRNEFNASNNATFESGDVVRISEVGLYDGGGNLVAIGKPDRHIVKRGNQIVSLAVKINV
jgi:hypothetical protein